MKARFACLVLVVLVGSGAAALPPRGPQTESDRVAADIRALNIINQLNLTREQLDTIIPIVREDAAERAALQRQKEQAEPALLAALTQLRSEVMDGFNTRPETERAFHEVKAPLERSLESYLANHQRRLEQVFSVLTPNQRVLLAEYKPCIVPLKDYKDPARIGRAAAASNIERNLEQIRQMPERRFQRMRPQRARMLAERLRKFYSEDEIPAKIQEFEQVAAEARAMSDVEFHAKKSELAARLAPPEKAPAKGKALLGRVGEFLMAPNCLALLEHKRDLVLAHASTEAAR